MWTAREPSIGCFTPQAYACPTHIMLRQKVQPDADPWNMPISEELPTIGVSVYKKNCTFKRLEHVPEATLNVAGPDHVDLVYKPGPVSRKDVDRVKTFGVKLMPSELIS